MDASVPQGDTVYCSELIELARGADVLVHEALYMPAVNALVGRVGNARQLLAHISSSHCTTEEAGKVAQAA